MGVSIQGQPDRDAQGKPDIPGRDAMKSRPLRSVLNKDRPSAHKNLDEVSILVAEARSTLCCDPQAETRIRIKSRRFESEPARLLGPRISLGLAHTKNMVVASVLVPTAALASFAAARCDLEIG